MLAPGDILSYRSHGFREREWRKLRRGQFRFEDTLDLHGMTVADAEKAFSAFLAECKNRDRHCILIIHGKGFGSEGKRSVIKNKISSWLRQRQDISAFHSAKPGDGGTGAVYVMLKGKKDKR